MRTLRPVWLPVAIIVAAALAVWLGKPLPPTLTGLRTAGPYSALVAALALAWWFNRGRSFVIAASILAGFAGWQLFPTKAVYTALVVIVPLNCLAAMLVPDRGARHGPAYRWLFVLVLEAILVAWIASAGKTPISGTAWLSLLDQWWLRSPPTPFVGRLAFAAAFGAAFAAAWPDFKPAAVGNAGAIAAFFIAAEWASSPGAYAIFMTACGLVLIGAVLQESHQLAFRDSLTGLPGRRALEERLRSLGEQYAVAMVDVDHFKKFNDTHGHDVGDQVLRLVGGRLAQVGGGGVAYRYGGEEFSVIFAGADAAEAAASMEAIRDSIEHYQMAVRSADRPKQAEEGAKRRGRISSDGHAEQMLSVTVSVGVASPSEKHRTPHQVMRAADEALYRAKKAGRNRVSK
jgi:diguanylate cyclase (GGDEF)-like protein